MDTGLLTNQQNHFESRWAVTGKTVEEIRRTFNLNNQDNNNNLGGGQGVGVVLTGVRS